MCFVVNIQDKNHNYEMYLNKKIEEIKITFKRTQMEVRRKILQKKNETWEKRCYTFICYLGGTKSTES